MMSLQEVWIIAEQKRVYIHNNQVAAGFVTNAIALKYSSAINYQEDHTDLEIGSADFFFEINIYLNINRTQLFSIKQGVLLE